MVVAREAKVAYENAVSGSTENAGASTTVFFETLALERINYAGEFFVKHVPFRMFVRPYIPRFSGPERKMFLGVYADTTTDDRDNMNIETEVTFKMHPFRAGLPTIVERVLHNFSPLQNFCSIAEFANWDDVLNPRLGYCKDGKILLECTVRATDHKPPLFGDRREKTGYVGLRNQGATCYMNSLLQTLFFLNKLRKATYQIPADSGDRDDMILSALQGVFYNLQFSDGAVGTTELTRSFGWTSVDAQVQQDAQELCRLLLAVMETKLRPYRTIPSLFEGRTVSYVQCRDVDYQSKREELFQDIQLNVKGKRDIVDSFRDYCAKELLDGNNKYDAGSHGLQVAEKGVLFKSFPPVLHLHLMRFQYDPEMDANVKINDRFEFTEKLDLEEFLEQNEDTPARYTLHAVLVHSQFTMNTGHYIVFVNPDCNGKWYMFNDESVASVSKEQAIERNFGGHPECLNTSAYMLVYVRDSAIADVFQEVTRADVPKSVLLRCGPRVRPKEDAASDSAKLLPVRVLIDDHLFRHRGAGLFDTQACQYTVLLADRDEKIPEFRSSVAKEFGVPASRLRFWQMTYRADSGAIQPAELNRYESYSVRELVDPTSLLTIYIEVELIPPCSITARSDYILLFLKLYEPATKSLRFICRHQLNRNSSLCDEEDEFRELIDFERDDELLYFKEISPDRVEPIKDTTSPLREMENPLDDGDIVILQRDDSCAARMYMLPSPPHYFEWMKSTLDIKLLDRRHPFAVAAVVKIQKDAPYAEIVSAIAEELRTDNGCLRLYLFSEDGYPNEPISSTFGGTLLALMAIPPVGQTNKLAYEEISRPLPPPRPAPVHVPTAGAATVTGTAAAKATADKKYELTLLAANEQLDNCKVLTIYIDFNCRVKDVLDEARNTMNERDPFSSPVQEEGKYNHLRLLVVDQNQIVRYCAPESRLESYKSVRGIMRVEIVPEDERELQPNAALVPCAYYDEEQQLAHGIPFLVELRDGEYVESFRKRIQRKLKLKEASLEKWRLTVIIDPVLQPLVDFDRPLKLSYFMLGEPQDCFWIVGFGLSYIGAD